MTDLRKAAEMALESLDWYVQEDDVIESMDGNEPWVEGKRRAENAIQALRQALEQPEQEPVAWMYSVKGKTQIDFKRYPDDELVDNCIVTPLYTAPPKREFIGLTDEEIEKIDCVQLKYIGTGEYSIEGVDEFARAIEAKLKEKNS